MTNANSVPLQVAITVQGVEVSTLNVRRPRAGDLRRMEVAKGGDLAKTFWLIGQLTDLTPEEVDQIDAADLDTLGGVIEGFTNAPSPGRK